MQVQQISIQPGGETLQQGRAAVSEQPETFNRRRECRRVWQRHGAAEARCWCSRFVRVCVNISYIHLWVCAADPVTQFSFSSPDDSQQPKIETFWCLSITLSSLSLEAVYSFPHCWPPSSLSTASRFICGGRPGHRGGDGGWDAEHAPPPTLILRGKPPPSHHFAFPPLHSPAHGRTHDHQRGTPHAFTPFT